MSCACSSVYVNHITNIDYRQAMIDEFDLDGDGEISEQEFLAIMTDEVA